MNIRSGHCQHHLQHIVPLTLKLHLQGFVPHTAFYLNSLKTQIDCKYSDKGQNFSQSKLMFKTLRQTVILIIVDQKQIQFLNDLQTKLIYNLNNLSNYILLVQKLHMIDTVGAIRVPRMIWTAVATSLGSLLICWFTCTKTNPTILDSALQYPYTIIFRVGMMYSLFLFFLQLLFIKWWIDSSQIAKNTTKMVVLGTFGLLAYGLFVCNIDRKRINYPFTRQCANLANLSFTACMMYIMHNLKNIVKQTTYRFISEQSYYWKKVMAFTHLLGFSYGALMYLGFIDINSKPLCQYTIVISSILFFATFVKDFHKYKMDIDNFSPSSL